MSTAGLEPEGNLEHLISDFDFLEKPSRGFVGEVLGLELMDNNIFKGVVGQHRHEDFKWIFEFLRNFGAGESFHLDVCQTEGFVGGFRSEYFR